jgi:hypothetical protein
MSGLCIRSDFTDYYDMLSDDKSIITYNRYLSQSKQRGTALKYLRSLGIKTLEIKQVNTFFRGDGPIVVYTDPQGHNGNGKRIMTVDDAVRTYGNCIASKYLNTDGMTIKYLQIGKRRFTLYFKKEITQSLDIGTLIDIKESSPEYNRLVGLPIFSIDYISDGQYMIATDFNEVENLSMIGMNRYLDSNTVINEIIDSLLIYNKI